MEKNYGKQDDKAEWGQPLLKMLNDKGSGLFSKKLCKQRIKDYEQWIKDYEQGIKDYEQRIKNFEQRIKNFEQRIKDFEQRIKDCKELLQNCSGSLDEMDIDLWIATFRRDMKKRRG